MIPALLLEDLKVVDAVDDQLRIEVLRIREHIPEKLCDRLAQRLSRSELMIFCQHQENIIVEESRTLVTDLP